VDLSAWVPDDGPDLAFPAVELERRVARTRTLMHDAGIDLLVVSSPSSIAWLTGFAAAMPSAYVRLLVPASGDLAVHCAEVEAPTLLFTSTIRADRIWTFDWTRAEDTGADLARVLRAHDLVPGRIGMELGPVETFGSGAIDARARLSFTAALGEVDIVDASSLVLDGRLVKSPLEIEAMRTAGRFTSAGLEAGLAAVRPGVPQTDVAAGALHGLAAAGSGPLPMSPMLVTGRATGWGTHLAYGPDTRVEHGDVVYLELTGSHRLYNAPGMRSAVVGPPTPEVRTLAEATRTTLDLLLGAIRPGRTGDDIAAEAAGPLEAVSEAWFHGAYGYSIGLGVAPSWTEAPFYLSRGAERELSVGMTFNLAICATIPGRVGLGFSESVVVTENGCECLTPRDDAGLLVIDA
jgi:Xaa-Pro dipeptidase